jgi:hypothetical protein
MTTADQVRSLLDRLGPTSDAVADHHRARGIKGRRYDAYHHPLARLLTDEVGPYVWAVESDHVSWEDDNVRFAPLPPPVCEFADRFDNGVYLDLCLPEGATP